MEYVDILRIRLKSPKKATIKIWTRDEKTEEKIITDMDLLHLSADDFKKGTDDKTKVYQTIEQKLKKRIKFYETKPAFEYLSKELKEILGNKK